LHWKLCIQCIKKLKSLYFNSNFFFLASLTSAPGTLVSMTHILSWIPFNKLTWTSTVYHKKTFFFERTVYDKRTETQIPVDEIKTCNRIFKARWFLIVESEFFFYQTKPTIAKRVIKVVNKAHLTLAKTIYYMTIYKEDIDGWF